MKWCFGQQRSLLRSSTEWLGTGVSFISRKQQVLCMLRQIALKPEITDIQCRTQTIRCFGWNSWNVFQFLWPFVVQSKGHVRCSVADLVPLCLRLMRAGLTARPGQAWWQRDYLGPKRVVCFVRSCLSSYPSHRCCKAGLVKWSKL